MFVSVHSVTVGFSDTFCNPKGVTVTADYCICRYFGVTFVHQESKSRRRQTLLLQREKEDVSVMSEATVEIVPASESVLTAATETSMLAMTNSPPDISGGG